MRDPDELGRAYRAWPPEEAHPTEAEWEAFATGELAPEQERRLVEHAIRCPSCSVVHRALLQLAREAPRFDPDAPVRGGGRRPALRPVRLFALAAGVVLAVTAVLLVRPGREGKAPVVREVAPAAPQLLRPVGDVTGPPPPFDWTTVPDARGYVVELLDAGGATLWRSPEVEGPPVSVPPGLLFRGGTYHWRVEARLSPAGRPLLSRIATFTVAGGETARSGPG